MNSRLAFVALCALSFSCSDAVPPPPATGVTVQMSGAISINGIIPAEDASGKLSRLHVGYSEADLAEIPLIKDGDGATVTCTVHEVAAGVYDVSLNLEGDGNEIIANALSANAAGTGPTGSFSLRMAPQTAGDVFASNACQVQVGAAKEGGGSIVATFTCNVLNDISNCDLGAEGCPRTLRGSSSFFVKDCGT
jgi:hypothetical protein